MESLSLAYELSREHQAVSNELSSLQKEVNVLENALRIDTTRKAAGAARLAESTATINHVIASAKTQDTTFAELSNDVNIVLAFSKETQAEAQVECELASSVVTDARSSTASAYGLLKRYASVVQALHTSTTQLTSGAQSLPSKLGAKRDVSVAVEALRASTAASTIEIDARKATKFQRDAKLKTVHDDTNALITIAKRDRTSAATVEAKLVAACAAKAAAEEKFETKAAGLRAALETARALALASAAAKTQLSAQLDAVRARQVSLAAAIAGAEREAVTYEAAACQAVAARHEAEAALLRDNKAQMMLAVKVDREERDSAAAQSAAGGRLACALQAKASALATVEEMQQEASTASAATLELRAQFSAGLEALGFMLSTATVTPDHDAVVTVVGTALSTLTSASECGADEDPMGAEVPAQGETGAPAAPALSAEALVQRVLTDAHAILPVGDLGASKPAPVPLGALTVQVSQLTSFASAAASTLTALSTALGANTAAAVAGGGARSELSALEAELEFDAMEMAKAREAAAAAQARRMAAHQAVEDAKSQLGAFQAQAEATLGEEREKLLASYQQRLEAVTERERSAVAAVRDAQGKLAVLKRELAGLVRRRQELLAALEELGEVPRPGVEITPAVAAMVAEQGSGAGGGMVVDEQDGEEAEVDGEGAAAGTQLVLPPLAPLGGDAAAPTLALEASEAAALDEPAPQPVQVQPPRAIPAAAAVPASVGGPQFIGIGTSLMTPVIDPDVVLDLPPLPPPLAMPADGGKAAAARKARTGRKSAPGAVTGTSSRAAGSASSAGGTSSRAAGSASSAGGGLLEDDGIMAGERWQPEPSGANAGRSSAGPARKSGRARSTGPGR